MGVCADMLGGEIAAMRDWKRVFGSVVLMAAVVAPAAVGCGDGGDGNDKDFVTGLCEASSALRAGVEKAVKDGASSTAPGKTVELMVAPVDAFVKAFGDLSAATLPDMTLQVIVGNDVFQRSATWTKLKGSWKVNLN